MTQAAPDRLAIDDCGFAVVRDGKNLASLAYKDVRQITAYKADLFTYDLICLGFRISEGDDWIEVNEEMEGYAELLDRLRQRFPSMLKWSDWWPTVVCPAFEANPTILWPPPGSSSPGAQSDQS